MLFAHQYRHAPCFVSCASHWWKKSITKTKSPSCLCFAFSVVLLRSLSRLPGTIAKDFFFFFWQVNRSKVDFFFWLPCHTNAIQQWLRSGCTAPPRFLSPQLSAGLFPGSFCFCFVPCSAISISLRPKSDCLMFLMQKSALPFEFFCCLSRGDVSSSELSVYDAAKMRNKQTQIFF